MALRMNRFVVLVLTCFLLSACDNNTPDAAAQYALGSAYDDGGTQHINYEKAKYWYEKSSARGNLDAMSALGFMYEKGKGMEVNYKKAIEIYKKAAGKGHYYSHIHLSWMYSQGIGVEKNSDIAAQWSQKAKALEAAGKADEGEVASPPSRVGHKNSE